MSRTAQIFRRALAPALAAGLALAGTGCCCTGGGGYGSYYGAPAAGGDCGCNPGYGAPVYPQGAFAAPAFSQTASAPVIVTPARTASAPVNCVPTY